MTRKEIQHLWETLEEYQRELMARGDLTPSTLNTYLVGIRRFARWCEDRAER